MATSTPPASPLATTIPAPLKPGYLTSEGWLSLLTVFLGSLPTLLSQSKLLANASPIAVQIAGLIVSGLSTVHFTAQRSSLKKAHLAATAARYQTPVAGTLAATALTALIIGLVCSCSGASPTIGQIGNSAGSAAIGGLDCEGVNLEGLVGVGSDANLTVAEAFALALASQNWAAAVSDLVGALGSITVGCAELAWKDFQQGLASAGGSAIATSVTAPSDLMQRAAQLEKQYGWKRGPAKAVRRAAMHATGPTFTDVATEPVGEDGGAYRRAHRQPKPVGSANETGAP